MPQPVAHLPGLLRSAPSSVAAAKAHSIQLSSGGGGSSESLSQFQALLAQVAHEVPGGHNGAASPPQRCCERVRGSTLFTDIAAVAMVCAIPPAAALMRRPNFKAPPPAFFMPSTPLDSSPRRLQLRLRQAAVAWWSRRLRYPAPDPCCCA